MLFFIVVSLALLPDEFFAREHKNQRQL